LPPLLAQNTEAGFASAQALCGPISSIPIKINPKVRRILFSPFACFALVPTYRIPGGASLDHLVGEQLHRVGHHEAERLGGLEIDDELEAR
jgi:hypothetical protein